MSASKAPSMTALTASQAKIEESLTNWRSIIPLKTNRSQVEHLLGSNNSGYLGIYRVEDGKLSIEYSSGSCGSDRKGGWNVPKDVVISIMFSPTTKPRLSDLNVNRKRLRKVVDRHVGGIIYYIDDENGIVYEIQDGRVETIEYGPPKKYKDLACPEVQGA